VIGSLALAALALATGGVERQVAVPGKFYSPGRKIVLIGDTVTWRNSDSSSHTVTADDLAFNSGSFGPGSSFSLTFSSAGIYHYHCVIHRYMRAEVDVYGLALSAPGYAVPVGLTTALKGLAPPDVREVVLRRRGSDGRFADVGTAAVAADGSFSFPLIADMPGVYVAVAGALTSAPVTFAVAARLRITAKRSGNNSVLVTILSDPAQSGAIVELQRYVLERFAFSRVRRAQLDATGRARFRLTIRHKTHLRALLPTGTQGYGRAVSPTVVVSPR
jgi:plastocyanin